jgi:hypothetical protein
LAESCGDRNIWAVANPKVFLSYSHDSQAHKAWVLQLATSLRKQGVDAVLDQWDLAPGQDLAAFMQHGIAEADRVVMVCSANYVAKAEGGVGGVGFERLIVTAEVSANTDTKKFIPITRNNLVGRKVPIFMGHRLYIDFEGDERYSESLEELARELLGMRRLEKPELGVPNFSAAPTNASAESARRDRERSLDGEWFSAQNAHADAGLAKLGFVGSMEVRSWPDYALKASQRALLTAVEDAEVHTFGWPIGITLNREEYAARPYADGVRAEVSIPLESSKTGNPSYDYWAMAVDGKFYTQLNLFEDDRSKGFLFFNTRIIRVAEALMFLSGVYAGLGVPPDASVKARFVHKGLAGRTLTASSANRHVPPRTTAESVSSFDLEFQGQQVAAGLPRLVQQVCAPMFMLFDFAVFQDVIYDDIVTRFQNGEAS